MESNRPRARRGSRRTAAGQTDPVWNVLTILIFAGLCLISVAFVMVFSEPNSSLNPFPPPTLQPTLFFPSPTPFDTAVPVIPSNTPTITLTPTFTPIPPTATLTQTPTATVTFTPGPSPTATINSLYPFILRGDPVAIAGSAIPDHDECKLWVAGQAYDLQGAPMVGITVQLGGYLGRTVSQFSLTGTALQFGPAGYEFTVSNTVQASTKDVWVMLLDQASVPLSNRIYFDTFNDCERNIILINFRQIR
jgi:hypothetical protein